MIPPPILRYLHLSEAAEAAVYAPVQPHPRPRPTRTCHAPLPLVLRPDPLAL